MAFLTLNRLTSLAVLSVAVIPATNSANAQPHKVTGLISSIANVNSDTTAWLQHGLGRFSYGEEPDDLDAGFEANIEYKYQATQSFRFRTNIQTQAFASNNSVDHIGLIEWEFRYRKNFSFNHQATAKLGQFFNPTSMENTSPFWESPYSITYSSLNSWIGEEFRPIGLDFQYRYHTDEGSRFDFGVTPFVGNDAMGALLAYRGWSYGRLRTSYNDALSLPKTQTLSDSGMFAAQRDDGTKSFGKDLDNRLGHASRLQYSNERLLLSVALVDNRGDRELHRGEYAWRTRFTQIGASYFVSPRFEILAEAMKGRSVMGKPPGMDIDFYSTYFMASYLVDDLRLSYRYDLFGIDDRDLMDDENNEEGRSHMVAIMWDDPRTPISAGAEFMYLSSSRQRTLEDLSVRKDKDVYAISALFQYSF